MKLSESLRTAIMANTDVLAYADSYKGGPAVFIQDRVPDDAPHKMVYISENVGSVNIDWVNTHKSIIMKQIYVYGEQPRDTKAVNLVSESIRAMFHRNKASISLPSFKLIEIMADYPIPAQDNSPSQLCRVIMLSVSVQRTQAGFY
jgi:2',3'-cyclic-nucleotide 2'-phosphodiesterase (5'-nucleotidase family)